MNDLALVLKVSHSRITRIIDTLVKKKLVKRYPSKQDRRSWLAEITSEGRSTNEQSERDFMNNQKELLKRLPKEKIDQIYDDIKLYLETFNKVLDERDKKK